MSKSLRVLVVEDSEIDTELALRELRQGGYDPSFERVDTAEEMSKALEGQSWDIVLADYVMPRFSGLAALELLKAKGIETPFIIVSGRIGEDLAVEAMKAGANDYIVKGSLTRLVPAVARDLRDAEVRRERRRAEEERDRLMQELRNVNEQLILSSIHIQEQAAEVEAIITALAEAVVVFGKEGQIVRMNPAADELLGYSLVDREKSMAERLEILRLETANGEAFPLETSPAFQALRGEVVRGVAAVIHRASDGKAARVLVSAAPIKMPDGQVRGAVTIISDITALREKP